MIPKNFLLMTHRRYNCLTGEWVLVSPQRTQRPWQGEVFPAPEIVRPSYVEGCYLCPGNVRANGERNPQYRGTFVFSNDFSALMAAPKKRSRFRLGVLLAQSESGLCRVVNFTHRHDLTLAEMELTDVAGVVEIWCRECETLSAMPHIQHIQIFENKGAIMGNSNPHPHGQIWAQSQLPTEALKECQQFKAHHRKNGRSLLEDYLDQELTSGDRVVWSNETFVALVPFWAVWPYETLVVPRRRVATLSELEPAERLGFAEAILAVTIRYDNLFRTSFPYSAGIHQAPFDKKAHDEWHMHMHFYPPLLRSATVKKYQVGYEMLAEAQRDFAPEHSAVVLRGLPASHYKNRRNG